MADTVSYIGAQAFYGCSKLESISLPRSLATISYEAFENCAALKSIYFSGNAPRTGAAVFKNSESVIIYYLPDATGWGATFVERPTMLWNPQLSAAEPTFALQDEKFGFTISATSELNVVVEACADLANPNWIPVAATNAVSGSFYFSDPESNVHLSRFYRLRSR